MFDLSHLTILFNLDSYSSIYSETLRNFFILSILFCSDGPLAALRMIPSRIAIRGGVCEHAQFHMYVNAHMCTFPQV